MEFLVVLFDLLKHGDFCANQLHLELKALIFPSHLNGKHKKQPNWNSTKWWPSKLYGEKTWYQDRSYIIIIIISTAIEFSLGGSSSYSRNKQE